MATGEQTGASGGAAGEAQQQAREVTGQAQDKAQQAAGQAKQQAQEKAQQAKQRVREQVGQRSTQAGEQIRGQAGDVRSVAEHLRQQGKDKPAQLAEQAAGHVERAGSYLEESDADRILADVEDFARQRPWAVVAGGIALGVAASRFVKASSAGRSQQSLQQLPAGTPPSPTATAQVSAPTTHGVAVDPALDDGRLGMGSK
ncbi:MAG TPA: hypothetical protein VGR11_00735 [Solirubrobacteraceae bacterium]|nr:hypothetical protein [Solirubrobacteraceae bacterium]